MKKYALLIMLSLFAYGKPVCAQSYYTNGEIGFSAGAAQYFGDLNDNYGFRTPAPAFGMFYRKRFNFYVSVKAVFNYTSVGYDDKLSKSPFNQVRNLNFKSDIYELGLQAEFNFFKFITADRYYRCTPYLTGGIGVFYYDPYTTYKGIKFHLRDIGTEGQNLGNEELNIRTLHLIFPLGQG